MNIEKVNFSNYKLIFLYFVLAFSICLSLNLGILKDYIFLDANEYLYTASRNENFLNEFIQGGRPLLGVWCKFLYGDICNTISDLKWIRLFALFFSVIFSSQVFNHLLKIGLKKYESSIFSLLILTLPSFTVYFSWSATAEIPVLLILNFYAGQLLNKQLNQKRQQISKYIIPFLIVFVSLLIYQSVVMVFLIPFVFSLLLKKEIDIKKYFYLIVFTLTCFISYYICFKISLDIYDIHATSRAELSVLKLPKKIIKFYLFELSTLVKGSGFLIASIPALILGIISFVGFFYISKDNFKKSLLFLCIAVLVLALSYAPNILSGQSYFSLRTIAPTAILVLFYQFYFFKEICNRYPKFRKSFLLLPIIYLIMSAFNNKIYVTDIQHKEYTTVAKLFNNINTNKNITVIIPKHGFLQKHKYLKNGFSGEFGNLSSVKEWATPHLLSQIKWEALKIEDNTFEIFSPKNVSVITEDKLNLIDKNTTVINLVATFKKVFSIP